MTYTVVLEVDPDGGFVVYIPALPGCISEGETREEALANIREAAQLYIEECVESGHPVPTEADKEFLQLPIAG
jgi:predicted RNase H-like HicB family nuclease